MLADTIVIDNEVNIAGYRVNGSVLQYIKEASILTGVSFKYLLAKAGQESGFNTKAKAKTSTATGIYQFTENTWLQLFKIYGDKYGYGELTKEVYRDRRGRYRVTSKLYRKSILNLRNDVRISSLLAAEFAKENKSILSSALNREISSDDLYLAHFLGPGGAVRLLQKELRNKNFKAKDLFPEAAIANIRVFYKNNDMEPRTVSEVRKFLSKLFRKSLNNYTNLPPNFLTHMVSTIPKKIEELKQDEIEREARIITTQETIWDEKPAKIDLEKRIEEEKEPEVKIAKKIVLPKPKPIVKTKPMAMISVPLAKPILEEKPRSQTKPKIKPTITAKTYTNNYKNLANFELNDMSFDIVKQIIKKQDRQQPYKISYVTGFEENTVINSYKNQYRLQENKSRLNMIKNLTKLEEK